MASSSSQGAGVLRTTFVEDVSAVPFAATWLADDDEGETAIGFILLDAHTVQWTGPDNGWATVGGDMLWLPVPPTTISPASFTAGP